MSVRRNSGTPSSLGNYLLSPTQARSSLNSPVQNKPSQQKRGLILEKPLNRIRGQEVSLNAFSFLFSELITYTQNRVADIQDLEKRLALIGHRIGIRILELLAVRHPKQLTNYKREILVQDQLAFISTTVWQYLFNKPVSAFERSTESLDQYMLTDNEPILIKFLSIPKELQQLSGNALVAGIVEGILVASQFPCKVTAHSVALPEYPLRTTLLIKLDQSVIDRELTIAKN